MFLVATIIVGWLIFNFLVRLISTILGFNADDMQTFLSVYLIIGFCIMNIYKIQSPLITSKNKPFETIKKIELKLFFKDLYFAAWWPYYIVRNLKNKS